MWAKTGKGGRRPSVNSKLTRWRTTLSLSRFTDLNGPLSLADHTHLYADALIDDEQPGEGARFAFFATRRCDGRVSSWRHDDPREPQEIAQNRDRGQGAARPGRAPRRPGRPSTTRWDRPVPGAVEVAVRRSTTRPVTGCREDTPLIAGGNPRHLRRPARARHLRRAVGRPLAALTARADPGAPERAPRTRGGMIRSWVRTRRQPRRAARGSRRRASRPVRSTSPAGEIPAPRPRAPRRARGAARG